MEECFGGGGGEGRIRFMKTGPSGGILFFWGRGGGRRISLKRSGNFRNYLHEIRTFREWNRHPTENWKPSGRIILGRGISFMRSGPFRVNSSEEGNQFYDSWMLMEEHFVGGGGGGEGEAISFMRPGSLSMWRNTLQNSLGTSGHFKGEENQLHEN